MGKTSIRVALSLLGMAELAESFVISQLFCLWGVALGPQEVNRVEDVAQW